MFFVKCKLIPLMLFGTMYQSFMKIVRVVFELCVQVCAKLWYRQSGGYHSGGGGA